MCTKSFARGESNSLLLVCVLVVYERGCPRVLCRRADCRGCGGRARGLSKPWKTARRAASSRRVRRSYATCFLLSMVVLGSVAVFEADLADVRNVCGLGGQSANVSMLLKGRSRLYQVAQVFG